MLPLQITLRDIPDSPALKDRIRELTDRLTHCYDRINRVQVVVEWADKNKHHGKLYNVRIDLSVPSKTFAVTHKMDEDVFVAVRDAFAAMSRQLEEHARKRNGHVKTHVESHHGVVSRLVPDEGFGFIDGNDGHEYYFSVTNVIYPSFDQIMIGDLVEYTPELLKQGWQAQHVTRKKESLTV